MRLLIVEDEQKIARALKKGLEQERYAVDVVYDGKQGVSYGLGEEYDAIILDLMLPEKDGLTVCRELRQKQVTTPILILTAKDKVSDKVLGLNEGADDYLAKPFSFDELLARVRALTRRPKQAINPTLKYGDLTLNTTSYEVKRQNRPIHLSAKEFALLDYLLRRPDRISTKDDIINHVWDYDADILPNTVEVYIGYLRTKIDKPFPDEQLIHTVRGFGYKLGKK